MLSCSVYVQGVPSSKLLEIPNKIKDSLAAFMNAGVELNLVGKTSVTLEEGGSGEKRKIQGYFGGHLTPPPVSTL